MSTVQLHTAKRRVETIRGATLRAACKVEAAIVLLERHEGDCPELRGLRSGLDDVLRAIYAQYTKAECRMKRLAERQEKQ